MSTTPALLRPSDELDAPTDVAVADIAAMSLQEQFELFKALSTDERMRLEAEVLAFQESEDRGEPVSVDDLWGEPEFRAAWANSEETNTPLAFNYQRILKDGIEDTRAWARAGRAIDSGRVLFLRSRCNTNRTIVLRRYGATRGSSHRRSSSTRRATRNKSPTGDDPAPARGRPLRDVVRGAA